MKKLLKNRIFIVVITMIICISGTLYATNLYKASEVVYSSSDGTTTDVNTALNNLYSDYNSLKKKGNATANQILNGKTAIVNGNEITGKMNDLRNTFVWVNDTNGSFNDNVDYTNSKGKKLTTLVFHSNSSGYMNKETNFIFGSTSDIVNMIKSGSKFLGVTGKYTSDATATAGDILSGKTAYVNGKKITGSIVNRGAVSQKITAGGSYTIPAGYHNGSGKVDITHIIKSWTPNYGKWTSSDTMYTEDTYTVNATSLYVLVRPENGGSVYQYANPTCSDGTVTLLVNTGTALLYSINKKENATFTLTVGIKRNYSTNPNATLRVYSFIPQ